jgi:ankyrin repeat protein
VRLAIDNLGKNERSLAESDALQEKSKPLSKDFLESVRVHNLNGALFEAIEAAGEDVTEVIKAVQNGANLNTPFMGVLPLECAINHNKFERFKTLAAIKPTVGEMANLQATLLLGERKIAVRLLHYAATLGRSCIVKFMVLNGVDTTTQDNHKRRLLPIHYAARSGDCATLDALNVNQQAISAVSGAGDFPLHLAAECGKVDMVAHLLGIRADPNCRDHNDKIPLHRAAQRGQKEVVAFLLKQQTSRNHCDMRGRNSFLYCVESGDVTVVKMLVLEDDKYNVSDLEGITAMHIAAEKNKLAMMQFLNGKDGLTYTVKDKKGRSPIHFAAENNATKVFDGFVKGMRDWVVKELAEKFKSDQVEARVTSELCKQLLSWQDDAGDSIIEYAVRGNATDICTRLIQLGVNLNRTNLLGCTPMHEAAKIGNPAMITVLSKNGVSCTQKNAQGRAPVHVAAEFGKILVLDEFKKMGDVDFKTFDSDQMQPIHVACCAGQRLAVDWFLDHHLALLTDVDKAGRNCLFHAARGDQETLVIYLVNDKKMLLNTLCNKKLTVIHHAVFKKAIKAIRVLVKLGLSLETPGEGGLLSFHLACRSGLIDMVEFLASEGVNRNACSDLGRNAWFYAGVEQNTEMLLCLEKLGVTLDGIVDHFGMSPLHVAASGGNLEALKFFGKKGLDCFAKDKNGDTPQLKASKQSEKLTKELAKIMASAAYDNGKNHEEVEKCRKAEARIAGCKAVESYLIDLERQVVDAKIDDQAAAAIADQEAKKSAKRDREEPAKLAVEIRIIKPKKWIPLVDPPAHEGKKASDFSEEKTTYQMTKM